MTGLEKNVKNLNRSTNIITTNTEYTIDPQINIEETTLYYYETLEGRATPYNGSYYGRDPLLFTCLFKGESSY
jgi:hypothetical protein